MSSFTRSTPLLLNARIRYASSRRNELWVTATRPVPNGGLGATADECAAIVRDLMRSFRVLPDPPELLDLWLDLVARHGIVGKRAHDARLVAFRRGHAIRRLATFNIDDFRAFDGLELMRPA